MITDGTSNWHYLAVKSISGLLRGKTSNHNGDFSFTHTQQNGNFENMKEYI